MEVTKHMARKVAKRLTSNVNALLLARAYAELERERVDEIQRRVLDQMGYEKYELRHTFQLPDTVAKEYYERLNAIHLADGFELAAKGYCPALCAESLQREAEWALIDAAREFFPEVTNNGLLCGTKDKGGLELRQEYLDLLVGLVVNQPGYRSPLQQGATA